MSCDNKEYSDRIVDPDSFEVEKNVSAFGFLFVGPIKVYPFFSCSDVATFSDLPFFDFKFMLVVCFLFFKVRQKNYSSPEHNSNPFHDSHH